MHKCQPNTRSLAKQNTKLFMAPANQRPAAAVLSVTGHTFSWIQKRHWADPKITQCPCAGASGLQVCTFLPDTICGEVLNNIIMYKHTRWHCSRSAFTVPSKTVYEPNQAPKLIWYSGRSKAGNPMSNKRQTAGPFLLMGLNTELLQKWKSYVTTLITCIEMWEEVSRNNKFQFVKVPV